VKSVTGVIQGGVVVLDQSAAIPEGTRVIVQVPESNWIDDIAGAWKDDEGIEQWLRERKSSRTMSEGPTL
jgi:hypothetical protein